jgi:hypothetical protein
MDFEDASIVRGVTEEEDHAVCAKVASLQECFSLDSLDVRHARLSFDEHESHAPSTDGQVSVATDSGDECREFGAAWAGPPGRSTVDGAGWTDARLG